MSIYGGYDRDALDAQYRARGRIADYESFLPRWIRDSAAARSGESVRLGLRYGPSEAEYLDLFGPLRPGAPLHLFFHGGYWQSLSAREFSWLAPPFVRSGAAFAVVNYAICPEVTMTELARQCWAAVAISWRQARSWGADPERLFVSGHSAGGHLTALLLATDWSSFAPSLPANPIRGGVAISGLYDLEPIRLCYVNDKLKMDAAEARALSPIHHIPAAAPALVAAVGGEESAEFHRQQADFVARWRSPARPVQVVELPGLNHFSVLDDFADPQGRLGAAARRQMGLTG